MCKKLKIKKQKKQTESYSSVEFEAKYKGKSYIQISLINNIYANIINNK